MSSFFEYNLVARKMILLYANDIGIDQPVRPFCLTSAFVIHSLERLID